MQYLTILKRDLSRHHPKTKKIYDSNPSIKKKHIPSKGKNQPTSKEEIKLKLLRFTETS